MEPEPIKYGEDGCQFCEMTIVSQAHSAQAVSTKGKQFKYDAIECMVHDLLEKDIEMGVIQVANYSEPGTMIDVEGALFLISESINSPMGANLAAVKKETGDPVLKDSKTYSWNELKAKFLKEDFVITDH